MNIKSTIQEGSVPSLFNIQLPAFNLLVTGSDSNRNIKILSDIFKSEDQDLHKVIICNSYCIPEHESNLSGLARTVSILNNTFKINPFEIIEIDTIKSPKLSKLSEELEISLSQSYDLVQLINEYDQFYRKDILDLFDLSSKKHKSSNDLSDLLDLHEGERKKRDLFNRIENELDRINPIITKNIHLSELIIKIINSKETQNVPSKETLNLSLHFLSQIISNESLFSDSYDDLRSKLIYLHDKKENSDFSLNEFYWLLTENDPFNLASNFLPFLKGQFDTLEKFEYSSKVHLIGIENFSHSDFLSRIYLTKLMNRLDKISSKKILCYDNIFLKKNSSMETLVIENVRRSRIMGIAVVMLNSNSTISEDPQTEYALMINFQHGIVQKGKIVLSSLGMINRKFTNIKDIEFDLYISN